MHELMFQAGVKGMSERSELIPCNRYNTIVTSASACSYHLHVEQLNEHATHMSNTHDRQLEYIAALIRATEQRTNLSVLQSFRGDQQ